MLTESNMLHVESPIGVGFLYSNTSSNYISWNDTRIYIFSSWKWLYFPLLIIALSLPGDLLIVINFLGVGQQLGMIWDLLWTGFKNFLCTKTDLFLTGESYAGNQWLSVSSESVLHILKELLHILGIELKILPQRF